MHLLFTLTERIKKNSRSSKHLWIWWRSNPTVRVERMQVLAAGSKVRNFLAL